MPTVSRCGVGLYFADAGDGAPVLFHTGGGGDGRMWELAGYTEQLRGYRRLLFDHRGHGRSDSPRDPEAHEMNRYVADVIAVLDAANLERAILVGYSGGASVLYRVAARHPERCAALVAIGSVPEPDPDPDPEPSLAFAAHVRKVGMRAVMEEMAAIESEPAPDWLIDNLATTETEMFALLLEAWAHAPPAWNELPAITSPALLVAGEHEQEEGAAHRAAERLPDGRAVVLPSYGHLQAFWHGEVTGPAIVEFLDHLRS